MATLKKRLAEAEVEFKAESSRIDVVTLEKNEFIKTDAKLKVEFNNNQAFTQKEELADKLVAKLLGS
jgi:hypothetical protein